MFQSFDYGKSLQKQLEAYRRLPTSQQPKRHVVLVKLLEQYAQRYLKEITKTAVSNPGQVKNGAEVMVEAAFSLQEPVAVYQCFAEMASRSRKVPVIPGLAQMVDRLLELPTATTKEKAALLSWRIVTGTMRPERYLKYLAERAHLTDFASDWKEYAYGIIQLVKKGTLKAEDDLTAAACGDLLTARQKLSDQSVPLQILAAESLLLRKQPRQAETVLTALAVESETNDYPENLEVLVRALIEARPESSWELHTILLRPALDSYFKRRLSWSQLKEMLYRARLHEEQLVNFLLQQDGMAKDDSLAEFTIQAIQDLPPDHSALLIERWKKLLSEAGVEFESIMTRERGKGRSMSSAEIGAGRNVVEDLIQHQAPVVPEPVEIRAAEEAPLAPEPQSDATGLAAVPLELVLDEAPAVAPTDDDEDRLQPRIEPSDFDEAALLVRDDEQQLQAAGSAGAYEETPVFDAPEPPHVIDHSRGLGRPPETQAPPAAQAEVLAETLPEPPVQAPAEAAESEFAAEQEPAAAPEPDEPSLAAQPEPEPLPEPVAAAVAPESLISAALAEQLEHCADHGQLRQLLGEHLAGQTLELLASLEILEEIGRLSAPSWSVLFTRLWLTEQLLSGGDIEGAVELFGDLLAHPTQAEMQEARHYLDGSELRALAARFHAAAGVNAWFTRMQAMIARLALTLGQFEQALGFADELPDSEAEAAALLETLEEWVLAQPEPGPERLMALAKLQRRRQGDAQAGFEAATMASLLAPASEAITSDYQSWTEVVPAATVHEYKAQQAAYLATREGRHELLPVALGEIEQLLALEAGEAEEQQAAQLRSLLEQLRPALASVPAEERSRQKLRWTRLWLMLMARTAERERLPAELKAFTFEFEPEEALMLVHELSGKLPVAAALEVECDVLLRKGDWQHAVELIGPAAGSEGGAPPSLPVQDGLSLLYDRLPDELVLPASERIGAILGEQGGDQSQLELVQYLHQRFGAPGSSNGGGVPELPEGLGEYLDRLLAELCGRQFEPARIYRLSVRQDDLNTEELVRDLLSLSQGGDASATARLAETLPRLMQSAEPADLIMDAAGHLANEMGPGEPDAAIELLSYAGLVTGNYGWALQRINALELKPGVPRSYEALGTLAIRQKNAPFALEMVWQLIDAAEYAMAKPLADAAAALAPDNDSAAFARLRLAVAPPTLDLENAPGLYLNLAQHYRSRDLPLAEALASLDLPIAELDAGQPDNPQLQLLRVAHFTSTGKLEEANEAVQQLVKQGPEATAKLLAIFDRLALEDTDLPSGMVLAWGQALISAGEVGKALDRLAGLRDAVGDYPEYIALLEETKSAGGGAGASMQLGEAYLRVHLWQRSAEEYDSALGLDNSLAEPIMMQLRHHGALDPNPMKYPLQVVALKCVAWSNRDADWSWAMSALNWLIPRWNAEELLAICRLLQEKSGAMDLEPAIRVEMLLNLMRLSQRTGDQVEALAYLSQAWEMRDKADTDMLAALKSFESAGPPADPELLFKLRRMEFEAAVMRGPTSLILQSAQRLAQCGSEGRQYAIASLRELQKLSTDGDDVLAGRLLLLDLADPAQRDEFVQELGGALGGIEPAKLYPLVREAGALAAAAPQDAAALGLLLRLLLRIDDQSRAWQVAAWHYGDPGECGAAAIAALEALATDEFAVIQQVNLAEAYLVRRQYDAAARQLESLQWSNLGEPLVDEDLPEELAAQAVYVAEAVAAALPASEPAAQAARRWLIGWYREHKLSERAADHLIGAYRGGVNLPSGWLEDSRDPELLYKLGQLYEAQGATEQATAVYLRVKSNKQVENSTAGLALLRLSEIAEARADVQQAYELAQQAAERSGDRRAKLRLGILARRVYQERVQRAREKDDSAARTLEIARIQREAGEISDAIAELQGGISRGQNVPEVIVELAECFFDFGEYPISRRAYADVIERLEREGGEVELKLRALYGLALASEKLNNYKEAAQHLEQLLVIRHNYRDSRARLAAAQQRAEHAAAPPAAPETPRLQKDTTSEILDTLLSLLRKPDSGPKDGAG